MSFFFSGKLPSEIDYRGITLGPRELVENSTIKNFEIFGYNDRSNTHILLFLIPEDQSVSSRELLDFYLAGFKAQGDRFTKNDNRHLGLKGDEVIYMTIATGMNAAVAYIEKGLEPAPQKPGDANDVFVSLAAFSFN